MWGCEWDARGPACLGPWVGFDEPFERVRDPEDLTVYLLNHVPFPISGTSIRDRQSRGLPIRELVPHEVNSYIEKYGLYAPTAGTQE